MALPTGITTTTVTFGVPVSFTGGAVRSSVSIQPSVSLVHTATGTPLLDFIEDVITTEGAAGQFVLPNTDQAGFRDNAGNDYQNWFYTAKITYITDKAILPARTKVFQLPAGPSTIDLDLIPSGAAAMPYIAPTAVVSSFNGRIGTVTSQESDLPSRLAQATLDSAYAVKSVETSKLDASQKGAASGVAPLDSGSKVPDANLPSRLSDATLNTTYVPKWKPNTVYLAGDAVLSPAGDTVTAKVNFTSGSSYSAANWNLAPATIAFQAATAWTGTTGPVQGLTGDYTGRYGVVGTGTDNRAAIQAMLNAASNPDGVYQWSELKRRGVTVTLPAGVYLLSAPSDGQPSLVIPEGVTADFSKAMMFFDYPATPTGGWSAIMVKNAASLVVPSFMGPSGRNSAPAAPGTSNTAELYDGVRVLGVNNVASTVKAKGASEIKGFKGASIRAIGAWVTRYDGPIMLSSDFGYIASNWPASNVYGYAHGTALPGIISGVRLHTDVYFDGPYFNGNRMGGYLGVVTGDPTTPHNLDFTRSGGHQAYFKSTIFEHFANYALQVTGGLFSLTDCAFEECGLDNQSMAFFNSVQSVMIKNHRINYTGAAVPGPAGTDIQPYLPTIIKIASTQRFTWESGYYRNTYSTAKFTDADATVYDVLAPRIDSNAFATTSNMYTPLGRAVSSGYTKALKLGSVYLWPDANGVLRIKSTVPTSDLDGTVVGAQT